MGILFKGITQILSESCQDEAACSDSVLNDVDRELLSGLDDLEELDMDISYTTEMVNVIQQETEYGSRYLVEYENLAKLMETYNCDELKAMNMICEHNMISMADTYLVIESQDIIEEAIQEAKDATKSAKNPVAKSKRSKKLIDSATVFKNFKNKGIKVLKKKRKKR